MSLAGTGRPRGQVLYEDVRPAEQPRQHLSGLGMLDIERKRLLRPVEPDEVRRLALHRRVIRACEVTHTGALDLDDAGAQISQLSGREGRGHRLLEREDGDPLERKHGYQNDRGMPNTCWPI